MRAHAGTVVDTKIVSQMGIEFYLASAGGLQGTTKPCKYDVVFNNVPDISIDELQIITFHLCHMYQRCTKSVSLPAPLYYARLENERKLIHYKGAQLLGLHDLHVSGENIANKQIRVDNAEKMRKLDEIIQENPLVGSCV